ncbi:putative zinc transporter 8 [Silene latifolia]|uniref:putative zinc transporter 8 n=1 Tax=Silene latifolia TaxID=37657 RepID=UPI003D7889D6
MASKKMRLLQSITCYTFLVIFLSFTKLANAHAQDVSGCEASASHGCYDKEKSLKLKIIGIFTILVTSVIGISLPLFSTAFLVLHPDRTAALMVRTLASGVILSTGFMHMLSHAWANLTSECLPENPWRIYPTTTLIAMFTAILTMMMDTIATAYYKKKGMTSKLHHHGDGGHGDGVYVMHHAENDETESVEQNNDEIVQGGTVRKKATQLLRYRVVAQVLQLGIVVHSIVIGLSMGVSNNPCTIRPLVTSMCFHQLFEGMALGGCFFQADYGIKMKVIVVGFFATTTPLGIAIGIAISNVYDENSPTALIIAGVLSAMSSGILIYMALVGLLAADFKGPKLQANVKLQFVCYSAVFLGMGAMSLMAKWA